MSAAYNCGLELEEFEFESCSRQGKALFFPLNKLVFPFLSLRH